MISSLKQSLYDFLFLMNGSCGICKKSLSTEYKELLRWRKEHHKKRTKIDIDIDHIIPKRLLSYKGYMDTKNLQLTHRTCNLKKGGRC